MIKPAWDMLSVMGLRVSTGGIRGPEVKSKALAGKECGSHQHDVIHRAVPSPKDQQMVPVSCWIPWESSQPDSLKPTWWPSRPGPC
ncbi:Ets-Related Transcription Factor Elf-2 [Manis pentadactyla]|nr:Ets-Related Transcription Factor Elf-2 [Manis pentadactyla]